MHGLTLSEEQYQYTRNLVREKGLQKFVTIELVDYRAHAEAIQSGNVKPYDRIVSIEMLEAVGHDYLGAFFSSCDALLAKNGLMYTQVSMIFCVIIFMNFFSPLSFPRLSACLISATTAIVSVPISSTSTFSLEDAAHL